MKSCVITGGSSGLGKALALQLAERGVSLTLVSRSLDNLKKAALELPPSTEILVADLACGEGREKLSRLIHREPPDLIINNAGFGLYGPALSHPVADQMAMIELNVCTLAQITLEGAQALIQAGKTGTILNISSAASFFPFPGFSVYTATKAFVNLFSQGLDAELRSLGIRILTVCPGQIDTGFRARASKGFPQEKDQITMSAEKAARMILKQLDQGAPLRIIDGRYRLGVLLGRLLPKRLIEAILKKSLEKRCVR